MPGEVYLTRKGYETLLTDLERLKTTERPKISKAIGEARLLGDLSENAEYDAAKDAQAHCEARIAELEGSLSNVRVIDDLDIPSDKIYIGAIVTGEDLDKKEKFTHRLVSPEEAGLEDDNLSIFSPIGKALMGHVPGDELEIEVPAGIVRYKVLEIKRQ